MSGAPSLQRLLRIKGRGANSNPANRFEAIHYVPEIESTGCKRVRTEVFTDKSRSIVTSNDSPDVGFDYSINPYRGCEHGCIYCYARPTHEYLSFSSGLDFETKILIKKDAAELLRSKLSSGKWKPKVVALSGITDPYQPLERKFKLTRSVLEVLREFLNPVYVVTKNHLVTRDLDLLSELAAARAAMVSISITTLDTGLQNRMEPRTSSPLRRLAAIEALAKKEVPVRVLIAPVLPALTDHEIPSILQSAAAAGARYASFMFLRLPHSVGRLFENWLEMNFPARKERVMNRIRDLRGGRLNDCRFHYRMTGEGEYARQVKALFESSRKRSGLKKEGPELSTDLFHRPQRCQMALFG